jgi:methyl-accepting chemotaxis protein
VGLQNLQAGKVTLNVADFKTAETTSSKDFSGFAKTLPAAKDFYSAVNVIKGLANDIDGAISFTYNLIDNIYSLINNTYNLIDNIYKLIDNIYNLISNIYNLIDKTGSIINNIGGAVKNSYEAIEIIGGTANGLNPASTIRGRYFRKAENEACFGLVRLALTFPK